MALSIWMGCRCWCARGADPAAGEPVAFRDAAGALVLASLVVFDLRLAVCRIVPQHSGTYSELAIQQMGRCTRSLALE